MRWLPFGLACLLVLPAATAHAGSALVLPPPPALEAIPAGTYDDDGKRIGEASLYWERMPDGTIHMRAVTTMTDGPRNVINAFFEEINDGRNLRVLREDSLSHDAEGNPMVLVQVDHEKGEARCTAPGESAADADIVSLPAEDRVANTTMSLLFQPLVRGEAEQIHFQAFLCRGGARLVDFVARRSKNETQLFPVVEIRFGPDLGRVMSWLASVIVPKLRFWFAAGEGHYLAHRMPLYGGGPEVVVAREGVSAVFRQP